MSELQLTGQAFRFDDDTELVFTPHEADGFRVPGPQLARALGFGSSKDLLRSIPDTEKGWALAPTPGGDQKVGYLTEAGFYRALGQRQAARITDPALRERVERFQSWVYGVVLPQIRRTGGYAAPIALPGPRELAELVIAAEDRADEAERLRVIEQKGREAAESYAKELEPKAQYVDDFVSTDDCILFRTLANQLDMPESELRDLLVQKKRIYRQFIGRRFSKKVGKLVDEYEWRAYAEHKHHFRLFPQHNAPRHHNNQLRQTLYITPPGAQAIQKLVNAEVLV